MEKTFSRVVRANLNVLQIKKSDSYSLHIDTNMDHHDSSGGCCTIYRCSYMIKRQTWFTILLLRHSSISPCVWCTTKEYQHFLLLPFPFRNPDDTTSTLRGSMWCAWCQIHLVYPEPKHNLDVEVEIGVFLQHIPLAALL
jgi:hypothetical protein